MKLSMILLALIPTLAMAGRPEQPKPETPPIAVSGAAAKSASLSAAQARAASEAKAAADLQAELAQRQSFKGEAVGNGSVDVGGDVSEYEAKALALGQMRAFAAPAVTDTCLTHSRGWDVTVGGRTGGTQYDKTCMDRKHCLAIADRYAAWGLTQAAVDQLATCSGLVVKVDAVPKPPAEKPEAPNCVTAEALDRAFRTCVQK